MGKSLLEAISNALGRKSKELPTTYPTPAEQSEMIASLREERVQIADLVAKNKGLTTELGLSVKPNTSVDVMIAGNDPQAVDAAIQIFALLTMVKRTGAREKGWLPDPVKDAKAAMHTDEDWRAAAQTYVSIYAAWTAKN